MGATNRKVNSIGSVIPVSIEVSAAESKSPPATFFLCVLAQVYMASAAPGSPKIIKDRMIISDGYNGTPSGFENICEDENGVTKPYVLHAEANAISKVAQSGNSSKDATLYVTASPCLECAKLIIQSGIKRVVYRDAYRLTDGIDLLRRAGIEVEQVE